MPDFHLVLQMADQFILPRQCPNKSSSVRRRVFLGRSQSNVCEVHFRGRLVDAVYQTLHEAVSLHIFRVVTCYLKCVVHENVSWK